MGCGSSSVPDIIIPDPSPGQKCHVLFKKTGFGASDQNVWMDCDTTKKWLMMDDAGSLWSNNKTYTLENFIRADGSKRGQPLCHAQLKITKLKTYGVECHEDSDSSSDDSDDEETEEETLKMKWAQGIKVTFYKDKECKEEIAKVKVKAKGKAKRTTKKTKDGEGNVTVSYDVEKKVKKVKYIIDEMKGEDSPPKIILEGKPNKNAYKLKWTGDVFQAEIDSNGWGSQEIEVKTDWKDPCLGMLMGYIISKEISPDDIKNKVSVPFS
jgi:hypothetical protein